MNIKRDILFGLVLTTLVVVYKFWGRKIGPCSPELETLLNSK